MSLRIALDWDGTVTEDEILWFSFMRQAVERGHDLKIVTARCEKDADKIRERLASLEINIKVVATDGKPKIKEADAQLGRFFDIWIDDMPHLLFSSSAE